MIVPRIIPGLELVDDTGDEVVIQRVNWSADTVVLETSDGDTYSMSLPALRNALRDGDFSLLEEEELEQEPDLSGESDEDE